MDTTEYSTDPPIFWARVVSNVFSPPLVTAVIALPLALRETAILGQALLAVLVYAVAALVLPVAYIAVQVRRGLITDLHIRRRDQRFRPFLVSVTGMMLAWLVMEAIAAPRELISLTVFSLATLVVSTVISLIWKISVHGTAITGVVVIVAIVFGIGPAVLLSPLIPVVGAARISLKRHTPMQVVAGTGLGALMALTIFAGFFGF